MESDFPNNFNAVLQWCKYWFRPILSSLTGFHAEQNSSIYVEWRTAMLNSFGSVGWQPSFITQFINFSIIFLYCCLGFFIIPWSIDWSRKVIFYWQKLSFFYFWGRNIAGLCISVISLQSCNNFYSSSPNVLPRAWLEVPKASGSG